MTEGKKTKQTKKRSKTNLCSKTELKMKREKKPGYKYAANDVSVGLNLKAQTRCDSLDTSDRKYHQNVNSNSLQ